MGIFAHVDAGKTTLTEQLLFAAGAIRTMGTVDTGNTHTDTLDLERERGISILSAPISFHHQDQKINILDTPGHVDFVTEVERSMLVLDGAVLVISAKEGVQSHTKLLYNALKRREVPTLIFVNKIDRMGVDIVDVLGQIHRDLSPFAFPLQQVLEVGSKEAAVGPILTSCREDLIEQLTRISDPLLTKYMAEEDIGRGDIAEAVAHLTAGGKMVPVLFGSAMHGVGISPVLDALCDFLPCFTPCNEEVGGIVFKVHRNHVKTKETYVKLTSGTIEMRKFVGEDKITGITKLVDGQKVGAGSLTAGDIGIISGLHALSVGDTFGVQPSLEQLNLSKPSLNVRIMASRPSERQALLDALVIQAEADPYLDFQLHETNDDIDIKLFGQVQMEIMKETFKRKFKLDVQFDDPSVIHLETIKDSTTVVYPMRRKSVHPFASGIGLRIEPLPLGSGVEYTSEITTGFLQQSFQNAVREGALEYIDQGLMGWELTDMKITLMDYEYNSVDSTPRDYRDLAPLVLFEAIKEVGTSLLWPINHFILEVPTPQMGKAIADLSQMKATFGDPQITGDKCVIEGEIPVETSLNYGPDVQKYTSGMGHFENRFHGYQPAPEGYVCSRDKFRLDPGNKGKYLLAKMSAL